MKPVAEERQSKVLESIRSPAGFFAGLKMYVRREAIEGVHLFAASTFGINKAEAETRLRLEAAFEALSAGGFSELLPCAADGQICKGEIEISSLLLEHGTEVDARDGDQVPRNTDDRTPLAILEGIWEANGSGEFGDKLSSGHGEARKGCPAAIFCADAGSVGGQPGGPSMKADPKLLLVVTRGAYDSSSFDGAVALWGSAMPRVIIKDAMRDSENKVTQVFCSHPEVVVWPKVRSVSKISWEDFNIFLEFNFLASDRSATGVVQAAGIGARCPLPELDAAPPQKAQWEVVAVWLLVLSSQLEGGYDVPNIVT